MRANMSIMGAYLYNSALFDDMALPSEMESDRDTIVGNLVAELAELELVHTNIDTLPALIELWSTKRLPVWEELYATLLYDYNPIYNYDRTETWTETRDTTNRYTTSNESDMTSDVANESSATNTDSVAGMNDPTSAEDGEFADRSQTVGSASNTTGTEAHSSAESEAVNEAAHENEHTSHVYGNIGVTTTQQMIEAQRNLVKFNLTDVIIEEFKVRFTLPIY